MKSFVAVIGIVAFSVCVLWPLGGGFGADKTSEKTDKPIFVDLDGDGFDDNAAAPDHDAIDTPNLDAQNGFADSTAASGGFFEFDRSLLPKKQLFLNNSSAFASVKQRVVSGLQHRGGFGSSGDFGPGGDIGSGAVIGGVCVGGICR